ncbi:tRNA (adenosine(37)-N6)-threonylcarbamoyltransferase complex ATPase subunit type 1 TsaE [Tepidibacillus marianensis]|uniref:tRNA (adenosine(37)-N6)-threonylcarbamoyltransferase complex ATPase subunit type 1 TsaE n=1 Tax=Tepidibacillus marianensis TaxID=3131995 RepID=UPI0030CC55A5
MDPFQITTKTVDETQYVAKRLANYMEPGDIITLEGDLGAGKTSFTQGLAKGLGISQIVNSPTFTIIKEYQGRLPLYHMDVYRLEDGHEDLGLDEYFYGEGISVIEWAEMIHDFLPKERLNIKIMQLNDVNQRMIQFQPIGDRYIQRCKEFFDHENLSN